jgi:hypothetical protein
MAEDCIDAAGVVGLIRKLEGRLDTFGAILYIPNQQLNRTALSGEVEGDGPAKPGSLPTRVACKVPIPAE